ncbi:hypothetical protein EBR96_01240 [bacterium]|nr:hypothetical protein [bacterium]
MLLDSQRQQKIKSAKHVTDAIFRLSDKNRVYLANIQKQIKTPAPSNKKRKETKRGNNEYL